MVAFNRFIAAAFAFFAASSTLAIPVGNATLAARAAGDLVCGADHAPLAGLASANEARLQLTNAAVAAPANRIVKVYWNVIYKDTTFAGGYLTAAQVNAAMSALNSQFVGSGMTFQRVGLKYTKNADWFNKADNQAGNALTTAMKNLLRVGTAKDLNIYSVGFSTSSLGGFATFPWWYAGAPKLDGVVFKWNTIPGGTLANYNQGKILTHEVGHWAGLYHTFQGGCSNDAGDYVSDTPAEATAATGCPVNRDSCPNLAGKDPIRNYMDYTYDTCKNSPFTPGQIARMKAAMSIYRNV